jgi:regulatory protein
MAWTKKPTPGDKPPASAYDKALGMVARREHAQRERGLKLRRSGFAGADAAAAIERLGEQHYQDDERFGQMLVRNRSGQGYGPLRIRAELKTHGIADGAIRQWLDEADIDWASLAAGVLRRRYGAGSRDPAERARRAQFLLRRGFSAATVRVLTHADVDDSADE